MLHEQYIKPKGIKMSTEAIISLSLYDPATGEKIKDGKSLNFNKANVGEYTVPVVIRMFVNGAVKVENVKIGIVGSTDDIDGSGAVNTDGSVAVGSAGIEHGKTVEEKTELTSFFPGSNETELSTGGNLVSVDNITANSTEYVYLNIRVSESAGSGYIKYKWFFDMA